MDIEAKELKDRLESGGHVNLIDVREEWEFEEVNIGAKNIPLGTLPDRIVELQDLQEEEIVVHCKSGGRSTQAKKYLSSKGFKNVRSLIGGIEGYLTS